jgi:hypothetical protein
VVGGVWPDQVHLSLPVAAGLVVGLPVLATLAAYRSLRRVTVSPLGLSRGSVDRQLRLWRLVPLAAGCAALGASALAGAGADDVTLAGVLLLVAVVLLLAGLVLAAPLVGRLVVGALARVARGLPVQIAAARVHRDAAGAARLVTGTDCRDLAGVVPALRGCSTGSLLLAPPDGEAKSVPLRTDVRLHAVRMVESADGTRLDTVGLGPVLPSGPATTAAVLPSLVEVTGGTAGLVDLAALPTAARPGAEGGVLLLRPAVEAMGTAELERVRTLLTRATSGTSVLTVDERLAVAERTTQTYRDVTLAALGCAALVGMLTLTSTLLQQVREHRRALVALWMTGMPARTLRAATLVQSALVILPVVAVSLVLAVAAAAAYLALASDGPAGLPWLPLSAVAAGAVLLPLLATVLTLPALRTTARPQLVAD